MQLCERKIELLAPARDLACGQAAVDSGADAVYIGAPRFGAREQAGNLLSDIAALVHYAHLYWVKVYVTLNTLLRDEELEEAVELAQHLYEIGIDGLIIQDLGLLECALPPLPLIASTQMHNDNADKVAFLKAVGFRRVILARELSLSEIRDIRQRVPDIELECFIHGALCVSYSGQCYLSYALGGRSGNRGQCAQPCRKRYRLVAKDGRIIQDWRHLLSLRDLNLSPHLSALLDAGVTAFKIEGRLKDRAYVANVVAFYRQLLDDLLPKIGFQKSSSGQVKWAFSPDPQKTFHRGYSSYFLHGRHRQLVAWDSPKHVGEAIGRVAGIKKDHILLQPGAASVHNGDGLAYFDPRGNLRGTRVNTASGLTISLDKQPHLQVGTMLYRNYDHRFMTAVRKGRNLRQIGVRMRLHENSDGLGLEVIDEDAIHEHAFVKCRLTPAQKPDFARQRLIAQLWKTGGTPFKVQQVQIELEPMKLAAVADVNALRRQALDRLAQARRQRHQREEGMIQFNEVAYPQKNLSFCGNVLNQKAAAFYHRHGVETIEPAAESGLDLHGRTVMTSKYCLRFQLGFCDGRDKIPGAPPEPWFLEDEQGRRLRVVFDCHRCRMELVLLE